MPRAASAVGRKASLMANGVCLAETAWQDVCQTRMRLQLMYFIRPPQWAFHPVCFISVRAVVCNSHCTSGEFLIAVGVTFPHMKACRGLHTPIKNALSHTVLIILNVAIY